LTEFQKSVIRKAPSYATCHKQCTRYFTIYYWQTVFTQYQRYEHTCQIRKPITNPNITIAYARLAFKTAIYKLTKTAQ